MPRRAYDTFEPRAPTFHEMKEFWGSVKRKSERVVVKRKDKIECQSASGIERSTRLGGWALAWLAAFSPQRLETKKKKKKKTHSPRPNKMAMINAWGNLTLTPYTKPFRAPLRMAR
jgi:hypothetical protein